MPQNIYTQPINDVRIFYRNVYPDERGYLFSICDTNSGIDKYVEDRCSWSKAGVLRGLHGDFTTWKYICLLSGNIEFALVDMRPTSSSYGVKAFYRLNAQADDPILAFYIPPGVLNGHLALEDSLFFYKWTLPYNGPENQVTIKWDDPDLDLPWSNKNPVVSDRDKKGKPWTK